MAAAAAALDPVRIDCADAARPAGPYRPSRRADHVLLRVYWCRRDGKLVDGGIESEVEKAMRDHLKKSLGGGGELIFPR